MKNLLRTSISTICYMRGLFPEECFKDNISNKIETKRLRPLEKYPEATLLLAWLEKGVFEALKKKYLEKVKFYYMLTTMMAWHVPP